MNKLSQAYNYFTLPKSKPMNTECNFCNNTDDTCCPEADKNQAVEREQAKKAKQSNATEFNRNPVIGYGALVWGGK